MFDPDPFGKPRVLGLPPGTDTPLVLASRVDEWRNNATPAEIARTRIFTNTRRLARRISTRLSQREIALMPRIDVLTDPMAIAPLAPLPPVRTSLEIALDLFPAVAGLLKHSETRAPRSAALDLSRSLASLSEEIVGEAVDYARLGVLDAEESAEYWKESAEFLAILRNYLEAISSGSAEARRRMAVEHAISEWASRPIEDTVIVLGSTASRRTTREFMRAVSRLPNGAIVLPGFDFDLPARVFDEIPDGPEDHPQFRNANFLKGLGLSKADVVDWSNADTSTASPLVSLALRPAPVTADWRLEAPGLGNLLDVTRNLTLLEAPNARTEAAAIALAMRKAIERDETVSLVTPDRTLGRRVMAALARWNIRADESSGQPLGLTPPGRFLQLAEIIAAEGPKPETVVAILKHPIAASDGEQRRPHLELSRAFELHLRNIQKPEIDLAVIATFENEAPEERGDWCQWLRETLEHTQSAWPACIFRLAETAARGPNGTGFGGLWIKSGGEAALEFSRELGGLAVAEAGLTSDDLRILFRRQINAREVRSDEPTRTDVRILGTLESRGQTSDVVILGGLNEGVWPSAPPSDPWLNRSMRKALGLLSAERETGLAAHDFQQGACGQKVILSRSIRDAQADTVPSRWISRLTMLLDGLPEQDGPAALRTMLARGSDLLSESRAHEKALDAVDRAPRPAPCPPVATRPRNLTVTEVQTLIRDPYAIYARHVLKLKRLSPLIASPDARLRGTLLHAIVEAAVREGVDHDAQKIVKTAQEVLADLPYPAERAAWFARARAFSTALAAFQGERRKITSDMRVEVRGKLDLGDAISVRGMADRIDLLTNGDAAIIDYKSGTIPGKKQIIHFDRQLLIEAAMLEAGGFEGIPPRGVTEVVHIGLARSLKIDAHSLEAEGEFSTGRNAEGLLRLMRAYLSADQGYVSRRAMEKMSYSGDFDHLARFGEWDISDTPKKIRLPE